jgi:uncharacterized protein
MKFEIMAEKSAGDRKKFFYDNTTNTFSDEMGFIFEYPEEQRVNTNNMQETRAFSKNDPLRKSKDIRILKIQLGLSCNYSCDYCSQKFVERPPETNKKDIDDFLAKLDALNFNEEDGLKVEFWGGEPLVYWKTLKPLAEALQERFSSWKQKPQFSIITNGSLLTKEICAWLYYMGFSVGISHDGPNQSVRGPDPFEDEEKKKIVLEFYKIMRPLDRISFNVMMNRKNISRKSVYEWFVNFTGDENVILGEGSLVDAYDEDGLNSSLQTKKEHFEFRRTAFSDIYLTDGKINFYGILGKTDEFIRGVLSHTESKFLGQKCGMDDEHVIAVDLKGNVVTCQNVSVVENSKNGEPHLGGNLLNYDQVSLSSVTHWKNRNSCGDCPVLHLCKGSCMYLDGKYWDSTCDNAYSDNVVLFALAMQRITGYIPITITGGDLQLDRQDIWGTTHTHEEKPQRKTIPIKVVTEKIGIIDNVEIYGKSRIENKENEPV